MSPTRITVPLVLSLVAVVSPPAPAEKPAAAPVPGSFAELLDLRAASRLKPWKSLQASGHDRGDGFYDSGNFLREEPGRRYVLMDETGPGVIDRIWMTRKSAEEPYELLLYLDEGAEPDLRIDLEELCSGTRPPFLAPFVGKVNLARYGYVPIGYARRCKVVLVPTAPPERYRYRENSAGKQIPHVYYQLTYRRLEPGQPVRRFTPDLPLEERQAQQRAAELWRGAGSSPWRLREGRYRRAEVEVAAGRPTSLFQLDGPGVLYGLRLRLPPEARAQDFHLEITWDDAERPAVSAPVGSFFGATDLRQEVRGLFQGSTDGELYCYFPMPFRRSARISLTSTGAQAVPVTALALWQRETPAADDAYFHARAYDHQPPLGKEDYLVLDTRGRGHWVGLVMDRPGNMEGDDRFRVDGEREPSIHGTGTEDFFSFAWGFSHLGSFPLHGITRHHGAPLLYRVHLPAAVPFRRSLRLSFEHGHGNEHQGRYSGLATYYLDSPAPKDPP
ncbi:MAG: glycoside hydrolase family 172 protein [Armatimonadota bacterium]